MLSVEHAPDSATTVDADSDNSAASIGSNNSIVMSHSSRSSSPNDVEMNGDQPRSTTDGTAEAPPTTTRTTTSPSQPHHHRHPTDIPSIRTTSSSRQPSLEVTTPNAPPPPPPHITLRSLSLNRELNCVVDFLSASASSSAVCQRQRRASTFSYEQLADEGDGASGAAAVDDDSKLTVTLSNATPLLKEDIDVLKSADASTAEKCLALDEMLYLVERAWAMPVIGREVAYQLCDMLRENGGVDVLLKCMRNDEGATGSAQPSDVIVLMSALVLSQSMTVRNREYVAHHSIGIETVLQVSLYARKNNKLLRAVTGILGCLFKESEETCRRLISMNGLEVIIYACRSFDSRVLRNCAAALANLAMYGSATTQRQMAAHKALDWLFPLAFSGDDTVSYYALIAIAVLAANIELEAAAVKSGTLKLVEPFVTQHDPEQFAQKDRDHHHGQSENWLRRLVPLLKSRCQEARILAAYHFAVEATIRKRQGKLDVFKKVGAVVPLKKVVIGKVKLATKFATLALSIMDEAVPRVLSPRVPQWSAEDVSCWVHQVRTGVEVSKRVEELQLDGDLLLQLTETNFKDDLRLTNGITRKRLLRELNKLRQTADYTSCDRSGLANWLSSVDADLRQYTYQLIKAGVTVPLLPQLSERHLTKDCGITNGVHRLLIMEASKRLSTTSVAGSTSANDIGHVDGPESASTSRDLEHDRKIDVFISYRRATGKHLAGLLKVYLALHGLNVYLDIESLSIGRFDENLLISIKRSTNFVLVLTANALDRCIGDSQCYDWVHKEIVAALEGGCKIIPVMDEAFQWPPEDSLPEDIRSVTRYQAIPWAHYWQDACVNKLVQSIKETSKHCTTPCSS